MAVAGLSAGSSRYFAYVTTTVALFVPQLALLAILLTTQIRVGPSWPLGIFLVISDAMTLYFSGAALFQLWNLHYSMKRLMERGLLTSIPKEGGLPSLVRAFGRMGDQLFPEKSWSLALVWFPFWVLVLGASSWVVWLWFNP